MKILRNNWILIPVLGALTWFVAASVSDDHSGHDHGNHEGHDHANHEGHDHSGHDHSSHDGHDHSDHGSVEMSPDECEIDKETQFLLDIRTQAYFQRKGSTILSLLGNVKSQTNGMVQIRSPHNATVSRIVVRIGERVKKGQLLAVLSQNISSTDRIEYKVQLENINSQLALKESEKTRLLKIESIIAKKQIIELDIELNRLAILKKEYQAAANGSGIGTFSILSPIDGVVGDFEMSMGQQLSESTPIMSIYNSDILKVEAVVYENQKSKIDENVMFKVIDLSSGEEIRSEVSIVSMAQSIDEETQTSRIILSIDNSAGFLKPGQQVEVEVIASNFGDKIVLPESAIVDIEGVTAVFIHNAPETFKLVKVKTGPIGTDVMILKSQEALDRVVVEGAHRIKAIYLSK